MATMLRVISIATSVILGTCQFPVKSFLDYNGVMEVPGDSLGLPIKYGSDAAHCKRDCFTMSNCTCAVFSAALGSCGLRTHCRQHSVHYNVPGGQFTVFQKLPDILPKYKEYKAKNTYSSMGSGNMAGDAREMVVSHETCITRCSANEECDCVVYRTKQASGFANSDGGCWLRRDCHPKEFGTDHGFSVYVKQRGTNAAAQVLEKPSAKLLGQLAGWKAKAEKWRSASKKAEEEAEEARKKAEDAFAAKQGAKSDSQKAKEEAEEARKKAEDALAAKQEAKSDAKKKDPATSEGVREKG